MGLSGMVFAVRRGRLLETGQLTPYHAGDDGDFEWGLDKVYNVYTIGPYAGTVNLDVPHYAGNQIAFAATTPGTITDAANGLPTFLTGDIIVVRGTALNDGVYNVSTGGVAGTIRTTQATVLEAAGAYVSLAKRAAHSNNAVWDRRTGKLWSRYGSDGEDLGDASDGALVWYNVAQVFTLHPAAADLRMIAATSTLRIEGGAGEIARYNVGDVIDCAGFANAVNNLPGYVITAVNVSGADLDIALEPFNNTLINEAAAGARSIGLVCRSVFGYAAAANAVSLGGYMDWRVPNIFELYSLASLEAPSALPDAVAFPGWTGDGIWASTTDPSATARAYGWRGWIGDVIYETKSNALRCALVRGG